MAFSTVAQTTRAQTTETADPSPATRDATGFYGIDTSGNPIVDRSGVMLVFDSNVVTDSINTDSFRVRLDDGSEPNIVDVEVHENLVFLKLANELLPDATPTVSISDGRRIELSDGIPPTLAMALSGGSGTGIGDEGPNRLTRDKIDITVTSDEPLAEPPNITVVCNSIQWTESADSTLIHNNIDNFIDNRTGQLTATNVESLDGTSSDYSCGSDDDFTLTTSSMTTISETSWSYEWRNQTEAPYKLSDGLLFAVAHARDQSEYQRHADGTTVHNWSAASANFTLDTVLKSPLESFRGYHVHPPDGSITLATRPHVSVLFNYEPTTVTLQSFRVDGVSRLDEIQPDRVASNRFLYWPPKLQLGSHVVEVSASDAAGNTVSFETRFESDLRPPFILRLQPGWNAISFPARPVDNEIESIFTDPSIRFVVKWHPFSGDDEYGPWLWSSRRQGKLKTHIPDDHPIFTSRVDFSYGLWVYSEDAVSQPVRLYSNYGYCSDSAIPRDWVFRGIIDWDDDQIEDHFGEDRRYSNGDRVTAHRYLGSYELAYRWDTQNQRYVVLEPDDPVRIGEAIWVYYGERYRTGASASCP